MASTRDSVAASVGCRLLCFGLRRGRGRGGWRSGFLAPFGFAPLSRLSRCFELGFGRGLRLRRQFGLGLADALSAPLLVGDPIRHLLTGLVGAVSLVLLGVSRFGYRKPFADFGFQ